MKEKKISWLNIVIFAFLFLSVIIGLKKGFIRSIFSLAGFAVGLVLAVKLYSPVAELLSFIPQESLAKVAAFVIIMAAVFLLASLLSWMTRSLVEAVNLGVIDHLAGAVFGFIIGAYFFAGLLALVMKFSFLGLEQTIAGSFMAQWLLNLPFISSLSASTPLPPIY